MDANEKMNDGVLMAFCRELSKESPRAGVREICVLDFVINHPGCSVGQIAAALWDDKNNSSASEYVNRWVNRGILFIEQGVFPGNPEHSRSAVRMTAAGRRMVAGKVPVRFYRIVRRAASEVLLRDLTHGDYWTDAADQG